MNWRLKDVPILQMTGVLLLASFICLFSFSKVEALTQTSSGDMNINGLVPGPPPSTPPTIESPAPGTTFTEKQITVKGSCISGLIVKIFRNNLFAGSALCQSDGTYSLMIDLFLGQNDLYAQQFDSIGQGSPVSNTVTVYYTVPSPAPPLPTPSPPQPTQPSLPPTQEGEAPEIAQFQLIIDYDYTLKSIFVNQVFHLPIQFAGGTGPYAVSIDWGDGTNDVFSRSDTKQFIADHIYRETGFYTVILKVSDSKGEQAMVQFVLLVNGEPIPQSFLLNPFGADSGWWWFVLTPLALLGLAIAFLLGRRTGKKA